MARKAKEAPHLRVRIPPALLARLEKSREKDGRTLTGEIVHRIEQSFKRDDMQEFTEKTARGIAEVLLATMEGRQTDEMRKRLTANVARPLKSDDTEGGQS